MKKIFPLLFVCSSILGVSRIVKAQQPNSPMETSPVTDGYCPEAKKTPEMAIHSFFKSIKRIRALSTRVVVGADRNNHALPRLQKVLSDSLGTFRIKPDHIKVSLDARNSNFVTARFQLVLHNDLGFTVVQDDSAKLEKEIKGKCTYWQIVPNNPSNIAQEFYHYNIDDKGSGFTTRLATLIAHPKKALAAYDLRQSASNLHRISLGLKMYEADYDNQINLTPQNYKDGLSTYVRGNVFFTAPGDPVGIISYNLNPNIHGINEEDIKDPQTLVTIYQGHDQKLDFKYAGYTTVSFMDGSVRIISREEAKNLRWKP